MHLSSSQVAQVIKHLERHGLAHDPLQHSEEVGDCENHARKSGGCLLGLGGPSSFLPLPIFRGGAEPEECSTDSEIQN